MRAIAAALKTSVAELYALAEGETLAKSRSTTGLQPADLVKDAVQMRKYSRIVVIMANLPSHPAGMPLSP